MYDYRQLIAEYLDAVAAGEGIQQAVGRVMKELFEKGNVSLLSRPQVSGMTMTHAGWDNISENDTATVYTMWYSGGTDGVPWVEDVVLHMTPIMSNGTVKTPEQLDAYVDALLANNNSVDSLLEADKPSKGGSGLVICVQRAQEGWTKAHAEADIYDTALHQLQSAYYLNGTQDLPLGKDLMTIAGWYGTYKVYIKNYIGFDGEYTTNEDLVYTVPIAINDEVNVFTEPKVTGEMGKAGTFEFGMQAGHPYYERLCQMKTIFRVVYDGDTIFRGRVLTVDTNHMNGNKQVHCEGDLAFLLDSQIEGVPDDKRSKSDALPYMGSLIAAHNAQMDEDMPDKKFELGEVPGHYSALTKDDQKVHPDTNYRYGSGSWRDSQSAWNDLTGSFGGFIRTRYQNGTCYIDWLDQYFRSGVNPQTIEIRENLIDLSSNSEVDNIFTAVIPVGSNNGKNLYINGYNGWGYNRILVPDITRFYSEEQLNQGFHTKSDYENAVKNYGIIYHTESFSNADTKAKLWEYALDWIKNNYIGSLYSFEVTALDMHLIGESSGKFLVGDKVNIIYPDSNRQDEDPEATVQKTLTIMGATYSLHDPSRNTYKIGVPNAVLKRNYGEKQKKKTSRASSSLSSQLADEANKQAEEVWEDTISTYDHQTVWGAILHDRVLDKDDPEYDQFVAQYGQQEADKIEAIAEQWLYDTVNGISSEYGSLSLFITSYRTTNDEIRALGSAGWKYLRSRIIRAANNNLPVWSKTSVTSYGQVTEVMAAEYAYPAVVHSKNGRAITIRKSNSANSSKAGDVLSDVTVWCRSDPATFTDEWMPVRFGDITGYMQTKFIVQCTGKYDQGTGYPELTETEKENKISFSQIFNSEDGKTLLSSLGVASPEELTKVVEEGKLPGVSIDGDGNLQLGDGLNYLINLMGGNSEINLGNGTDILARLFGMNGNDESSGFEFFKKLPGQLQQKILTIFTDGKTGTQTLLKQFFGGNDFTGINDLLTGIGLPLVTISADGTIELGTGDSSKPTTIKIDGNKGADGVQNKYGWIGIKKSNDGELSWVIQLNDVITYTDENNTSQTAYGFVSAADFHIPTISSFKTKLAVVDELVTGKITAADLNTFKATIDELYATKVEIEGMLTAASVFSGTAISGDLFVTSGTGADGKAHQGLLSATKVYATSIDVGSGGIRYYQENSQTGGNTYKEHYVKIGSKKYLGTEAPYPHILSTEELEFPDIIDASSIEEETGLADGKIGFKYKTYGDSTYKHVNFNIADTDYYKTRVGIKTSTIPNDRQTNNVATFTGWLPESGYEILALTQPYGVVKVTAKTENAADDHYIGINATGILSEANIKASSYYLNDVGIEGCSLSSLSANDWTDHENGHDSYNDNGTLTSKYGKVTVTAKDGTSFTFGINAEEVFNLGVIEGAGSADTESARISGYREGYGIAHGEQRVWASAGEVQYDNCYYLKTEDKNQLDVYTTGTSILSYLPLQNGSLDPDDKASTRTGSTMETTISLSVKTTNGQLSKGEFKDGKFTVKSVSNKKPSVTVDGEEIKTDVDDLELAIAANANISGVFRWAQDIESKKYYYYYDIAGSVTADDSTIIDLSKANQYHSADAAIDHGKGLMGVKAASWKDNVVTFEVEESETKKQTLTIISKPNYTYDPTTHKYKLSSFAYYTGSNSETAITGSSPKDGDFTTDDAAWRAGVAYAQSNTPAPEVSVSVDPIDQMEYTETEGSLATSPETLNASGFYVVKANVNGTERIYKKFKTGAQGTSSNEKIEENRAYGTISANGTGIEIKPSGSNTAMRKATLNVAVPQRTANNIKGTGDDGVVPLTEDDVGTRIKNVTVEYDGADAFGGTSSQNVVKIDTQPVYNSGQKSVKVLAVVRAENCDYDFLRRTATDDVTVYLDNGVIQTIKNVDFADAFDTGVRGESHWLEDENGNLVEKTPASPNYMSLNYVGDYSQNFSVELCDKQGNYVGEDDVMIDVSDIYEEGVIRAYDIQKPKEDTYYYTNVNSLGENYNYEGDDPIQGGIWGVIHGKNGTPFYKDDRLQKMYGNLHRGCEVQLLEENNFAKSFWKVKYLDHTPNGIVEYIGYIKHENLENVHYEPTGDIDTAAEKGAWVFTLDDDQEITTPNSNVSKVIVNSAIHPSSILSKNSDLLVIPKNGGKGLLTSDAVSDAEYEALKVTSIYKSSFFESLLVKNSVAYHGRHLLRDTSSDMTHKISFTVQYDNFTRKEGVVEINSYAVSQIMPYEYSAKVYNDSGPGCYIYDTEGTYGQIIGEVPNDAVVKLKDPPYGYSEKWITVEYNNIVGYMEAKYVMGTDEYVKLHPDFSEESTLKRIDVIELVHATSEYGSSVVVSMAPIGSSAKNYASNAVSDAVYELRPKMSEGMPDEFLETISNLGDVFRASHISGDGVPTTMKHSARLLFTYSDGRTVGDKYMEITSKGKPKINYTALSSIYTKNKMGVNLRTGPSKSSPRVPNGAGGVVIPNGATVYLQRNPANINEEWAAVQYKDASGNVYSGYAMSMYIKGTPAYYEYIATGSDGQPIKITSVTIDGIFHDKAIKNGDVEIKFKWDSEYYKYDSGYYSKATSKNTTANIYKGAFKTTADPGDFMTLLNNANAVYAYHNMSTYNGYLKHKVGIKARRSDNTDKYYIVEITSQPIYQSAYTIMKTV